MIELSEQDRQQIERLIDCKNNARRVNVNEVCEVYNRVLNKTSRPTGCAGCNRQRICDIERWYRQFLIDEEKQQTQKVEEVKEEPKPKKRGRKKKEG